MKITDLYHVATLGNKIDETGFVKINFIEEFDSFFTKFKDIFLVFKDYSVRYVTIKEVKQNRGYKIKLLEDELYDDIIADGKVKVCLEKKDIPNLPAKILYEGFYVFSNTGEFLGKITDVLDGKFHNIFVISLDKNKEITVPNIEHFVNKIDLNKSRIYIKNYEELLDI